MNIPKAKREMHDTTNLPYNDRYSNTDWQFEMLKRGKPMDMILVWCIFQNRNYNCSWYTLQMCTYNICPFNTCVSFTIKQFFANFSITFYACNEHVEMNEFLCSLACTWMTIIDSLFYIIDILS